MKNNPSLIRKGLQKGIFLQPSQKVNAIAGYFLGQKIWTQTPLLDSPQYPSPFYPLDLKVDIEGHEVDALPEWIESGALEKVFSLKKVFSSQEIALFHPYFHFSVSLGIDGKRADTAYINFC